jgi:hypothetical protein
MQVVEDRRTQERIRELANGGWEQMDPLTRRCVIVLADEIDAVHRTQRQIRSELADTRKTVIAMMSAIIVAVVGSGVLNLWRG